MKDNLKIETAHCNSCQRETNHWVVCEYVDKDDDSQYGVWSIDTFQVLGCCGCDEIKFLKSEIFSEDSEVDTDENGDPCYTYPARKTYFPPAKWRTPPRWSAQLSQKDPFISQLHDEIYSALQNGSFILANMGTRTLIEQLMTDTVGTGTFKQRLNKLADKGFIAKNDIDTVDAAIEAGHASTHRGWVPSKEQLELIINITENMMERIYFLNDTAKNLKSKIPVHTSKK